MGSMGSSAQTKQYRGNGVQRARWKKRRGMPKKERGLWGGILNEKVVWIKGKWRKKRKKQNQHRLKSKQAPPTKGQEEWRPT